MAVIPPRVVDRGWRASADLRRVARRAGSAGPARRALGLPTHRTGRGSTAAIAGAFERYRATCPPVADRAAVVCVTQRPSLLGDVVANVRRQLSSGVEVELVLVTNDGGFADVDVERHVAELPHVTIVECAPSMSLGRCLNAGLAATSERFVAKFDDDDRYGVQYVADALRAHGYAGAGVVGKHTYYAEILATGQRYLRFPGNEFRYSGTLAGGTLVVDRERTAGIEFDDVSLGEDRRFLAACHRRGVSTFAADRFGFVQRRGADNTWSIPVDRFLEGCDPVADDDPVHVVDR